MAYTSSYTERFPDLFDGLTDEQRRGITQTLANGHLEGWEPTREEISDLIDVDLGRISDEEYITRVRRRADVAAGRISA